jgi:NADPH:quinone reductase-like Zn-dependent oxidoreductase
MKAIVQDRYGPPEVLEVRDVDPPVPADHEVLVRVHAAAVNAADWHMMRGHPYLARLTIGLRRPRQAVLGRDFAGRVEAVGAAVQEFAAGDEVYGDLGTAGGAFAEYVRVPADRLAAKPATLSFEQAAAVPLAGITALAGLRDAGRLRAGQRLLVNGASGGVGTFAVQVAKALGAEVTGVCSTRNVELVRSLGADHVIDYRREDFARSGRRYDVVFDLVGNRSLTDLRRVLTPAGTLVLAGGGVSGEGRVVGPFALMVRAQLASRFARQRLVTLTDLPPGAEHLATLRELIESGRVTPVIERTYALVEVPAAIRHLEVEHARAKLVVTV